MRLWSSHPQVLSCNGKRRYSRPSTGVNIGIASTLATVKGQLEPTVSMRSASMTSYHFRSGCSGDERDVNPLYFLGLPIPEHTSKWRRVILDEAQWITNNKLKTVTACCVIDATYCWFLGGTPVMNNPRELYLLLKFVHVEPCK